MTAASLHQEHRFEAEICQHLGAHGWLYEPGAAPAFDTARGLHPPDLMAWLQATQPEVHEKLARTHGS
jgi:type I restriction enzyme R subunit